MNSFIKNEKWRSSTGLIFWGTTVQTLFSFLGLLVILYLLYDFSGVMLRGIVPSLAGLNLDYYEDTFYGFFGGAMICGVISFLGYVFYLIGICLFKGAQQSPDMKITARNVILVELIMPALLILLNVMMYKWPEMFFNDPEDMLWWGVACWLGSLVAVIILLIQFRAFSKSDTWSEKACEGASDVKFSYSCVLWMQGIVLLGGICLVIIIFSSFNQFNSLSHSSYGSYGIHGAAQGINSTVSLIDNLVTNLRVCIAITGLVLMIFALLQTIYRINGWRKIQLGGEKAVCEYDSAYAGGIPASGFCHKCGAQLPEGSAFCPKCGSEVIVMETSENVEPGQAGESFSNETSEPVVAYEENYEEETDSRKKWLLWGGIAAAAVAIIIVAITCFGPEKMEANARVLADHTVVFKSVEDGIGIEPIEELQYGTAVESKVSELDDEGVWTKVAIEKDGKVVNGYVSKTDLMSPEDYYLLDKAGMADKTTREVILYNIQRRALLDALKRSEGNWRMDLITIGGEHQPNFVRLVVRGVSPSQDCVGFILDKEGSHGEREFFLYSTPDIYNPNASNDPVYLYSEPVSNGVEAIYDVTYRKKKYNVSYINSPNSPSFDYEAYEDYAEEPAPEPTKEKQFGGNVEMSGDINDKYAIKMQFTEYPDGSITGDYMYVKNNVPIALTGKYTDKGSYQDIELEETVNGNVTGKFIGSYDGVTFSGSWLSSDETKRMPFKVSR